LIIPFLSDALKQEMVILAIDNGHLCGLSANREALLKDIISDKKYIASQKIEIPDDFTVLIDEQPQNHLAGKTFK
jgi:hypothetical protein